MGKYIRTECGKRDKRQCISFALSCVCVHVSAGGLGRTIDKGNMFLAADMEYEMEGKQKKVHQG